MGTFTDDYLNTYRTPYIPEKIVGFSGIDPSSTGEGGVGLSEDEINQLIAIYVSNLQIRIDSGRVDPDDDEPIVPYIDLKTKEILHNALDGLQGGQNGEYYHLTAAEHDKLKDYPLYSTLRASLLHEPLPDLLGGDANGHYHLTQDELDDLRKLIAALISGGTVVLPSGGGGSGTDDHEQLQNLLGGDGNGHYHVTDDEWTKLKALIATTFPPGSPTPVIPSQPDDDPDNPAEDPDLDPFAGLPPTMSVSWTTMSLGQYTAYPDAGRMYYGSMVTSSKPYNKTALIIPLKKSGNDKYTYLCSFTTDLTFDRYEKQASVSTFGSTWADYVYVDWGDAANAKRFYAMPSAHSKTTKDIAARSPGGGWGDPGTNKVTAGFVACCYSPNVDRVLLVTSKGEVTWIYDSNAKATTFTQKLLNASTPCGLKAVNMACATWSTEAQLFCVTGPDGVATSSTGDAGTWNVYTNAPKDLHDLEYHENLENITGGAFIAWSGVDRLFYVSRNGKDWVRYSSKAIPMSDVVQVAYAPEYGWFCAVGASGNTAYFSKTLTNWVATTISASDDAPIQSVIWMPSAKKFVLLPKNGAVLYTYGVTV